MIGNKNKQSEIERKTIMKKSKKLIILVLAVLMISMLLTACGRQVCTMCGEKKFCKDTMVLGTTCYICKDCQKQVQQYRESVNDLFGLN